MGAREKLQFYVQAQLLWVICISVQEAFRFFIQNPPLRMTGFQMGGGEVFRYFFQRSPQNFDPSDKFFKGANM